MQKTTVLQRNSTHLLSSQVGDELVMLDTKTGDYLGLNTVAGEIWTLLESPITFGDLCHQLMEGYDVDEATCIADTTELLDSMIKKNLVVVREEN